jgi:hypothetical protein
MMKRPTEKQCYANRQLESANYDNWSKCTRGEWVTRSPYSQLTIKLFAVVCSSRAGSLNTRRINISLAQFRWAVALYHAIWHNALCMVEHAYMLVRQRQECSRHCVIPISKPSGMMQTSFCELCCVRTSGVHFPLTAHTWCTVAVALWRESSFFFNFLSHTLGRARDASSHFWAAEKH